MLGRKEAIEYLAELGVTTYGLWKNLQRYSLEYTRGFKSNCVSEETLDTFAEMYLERQSSNTQGKKLKDFAPEANNKWREMCKHSKRKTKLKIHIEYLNNQKELNELVENVRRRTI